MGLLVTASPKENRLRPLSLKIRRRLGLVEAKLLARQCACDRGILVRRHSRVRSEFDISADAHGWWTLVILAIFFNDSKRRLGQQN